MNFVIFSKLKLDISRYIKDSHPLNIESIFVTKDVSKNDKSSVSNCLQSLNILFISSTEEVSILYKSIDFNEWHPENIEAIFVTEEVLKWDKSIETIFSILGSLEELK